MAISDRLTKLTTDITNAYTSIENKLPKILPEGYTQVEYIESTGTQYINTGVANSSTWELQLKMAWTSKSPISGDPSVYCSNGINNNMQIGITPSTGVWTVNGGDSSTQVILNKIYDVSISQSTKNLVVDGTTVMSRSSINTTTPSNIILFAYGVNANTQQGFCSEKVYSAKIYDNNILVRNLIPCYRNSDNIIGMYDTVNDVFYTNQGTGTFLKGNNVSIPNPDYPSDIHSVADDVNLFDKDNVTLNARIGGDGNNYIADATDYYISAFIKVNPNTQYVRNSPITDAYHRLAFYSSNSVDTFISAIFTNDIITPANCNYIRFCGLITEKDTIKLQKGTVVTPYSPYNQGTVTIKQRGKNLFDYNSYTYDKTILNAYRFIEIKDLKPNTVYVISNYQDLTNSGFSDVYIARDTKYSSIIFANLVGYENRPVDTDETGKLYLCVYASSWTEKLWNTFINYFENAQLEERKKSNFIRTISRL